MQKKVPCIVPCGVAMRVQLVYSKRLAGLEQRLVAHHGQAAHLLDVAVGVGDDPVPRDQLRRHVAGVADGDRVGERIRARSGGWDCSGRYCTRTLQVNSGLAMNSL